MKNIYKKILQESTDITIAPTKETDPVQVPLYPNRDVTSPIRFPNQNAAPMYPWGTTDPLPPPGWYMHGERNYFVSIPQRDHMLRIYEYGNPNSTAMKPMWDPARGTWIISPPRPPGSNPTQNDPNYYWRPGPITHPNEGKWIPYWPPPVKPPFVGPPAHLMNDQGLGTIEYPEPRPGGWRLRNQDF
jgi:hypothetical protein